ncbi:fumarylacetoacetate hydrolase family protein [Paenarthrobacter sp. NPDC089316]|uniref:fumarylacetoacetate hydrolase family protein n=1 Tax=unclassified Paenarthrobacter TaxID=2634190 RepID=UPI003425EB4D
MKLVSYFLDGVLHPAALVQSEWLQPIAPLLLAAGHHVRDMTEVLEHLNNLPQLLAQANPAERIPAESVRLGPPLPRPTNIVAVGLNYPGHILPGTPIDASPRRPVVFLKSTTSIAGPSDPIIRPAGSVALDYELEIGVVIGTSGRRISRADAWAHVAGLVAVNDITARDIALGDSHIHPLLAQIARGKSAPSFCPLGPWILTRDELDYDAGMEMVLTVNGSPRQRANSRDMLVPIPDLLHDLSSSMDLARGDLVLTGSPAGCGVQQHPPSFLAPGDVIEAEIEGLGRLKNTAINAPAFH